MSGSADLRNGRSSQSSFQRRSVTATPDQEVSRIRTVLLL